MGGGERKGKRGAQGGWRASSVTPPTPLLMAAAACGVELLPPPNNSLYKHDENKQKRVLRTHQLLMIQCLCWVVFVC